MSENPYSVLYSQHSGLHAIYTQAHITFCVENVADSIIVYISVFNVVVVVAFFIMSIEKVK